MDYSDLILDLYKNPLNYGELKDFDIKAEGTSPFCEGSITFTVKIEEGRISGVMFSGNAKAVAVAANSLLTEEIKGKTLEEVRSITDEQVLLMIGGEIRARTESALAGRKVLVKALNLWEKGGKKKLQTRVTI